MTYTDYEVRPFRVEGKDVVSEPTEELLGCRPHGYGLYGRPTEGPQAGFLMHIADFSDKADALLVLDALNKGRR